MNECIPVVVVENDEHIRTTKERKQKLCGFQFRSAENDPAKLKPNWKKTQPITRIQYRTE